VTPSKENVMPGKENVTRRINNKAQRTTHASACLHVSTRRRSQTACWREKTTRHDEDARRQAFFHSAQPNNAPRRREIVTARPYREARRTNVLPQWPKKMTG
jgi:hypothetical protein